MSERDTSEDEVPVADELPTDDADLPLAFKAPSMVLA